MAKTARLEHWWERPGPHPEGRQGRLALVAGRDIGITCPKCKQHPVVYNGNYFCDGYPPLDFSSNGACDWALAHPARNKRDREVCDLIGIDYE